MYSKKKKEKKKNHQECYLSGDDDRNIVVNRKLQTNSLRAPEDDRITLEPVLSYCWNPADMQFSSHHRGDESRLGREYIYILVLNASNGEAGYLHCKNKIWRQ